MLNFTEKDRLLLLGDFPGLQGTNFRFTSPITRQYNCHAFAVGDQNRRWAPTRSSGFYWPQGVPLESSVDAFAAAFGTVGFVRCNDGEYDATLVKVALYAINGAVKHTALQTTDAIWQSKLGVWFDITHELRALEGSVYGHVCAYLQKPR